MDEIDFESDQFQDIIAKDDRFAPRAYALVMDVVTYLLRNREHTSGEDILEEFRERTLDQYGPLSYAVLMEWGVTSCADVGEMVFNLVEARRIGKDEGDTPESFSEGYDFKEAFLGPYEP